MRAAITRHAVTGEIDDPDSPSEALEAGSLAIPSTRNQQELWQRPPRQYLRPLDGRKEIRFEITHAKVMPPDTDKSTTKKYVVYALSVRQDSMTRDPNPIVIERRYTDFLQLYTNLQKSHSDLMQKIIFPKKVLIGNFSVDLIAERSSAFEAMLVHIASKTILRDSSHFLQFLQNHEVIRACQFMDERRNELAIPLFENSFLLLNKIFMDRTKAVLLLLCRLVAACTVSPVPHSLAEKWADLALRRYEAVCDAELLSLYIPLLQTCVHLWWQRGRDNQLLLQRLNEMTQKGIKVEGSPTLVQAIHALDPLTETF